MESLGISLHSILLPLDITSNYKQLITSIINNIEECISSTHYFILILWKNSFDNSDSPFKQNFGPTFIGSDFPSYNFHSGNNSQDIWHLIRFHWIDLFHYFQVYLQLKILGKASIVNCDYNFRSVITYFLSYYSHSLRMSKGLLESG